MVEKRLLKEFKFMLILTASDSGFKKIHLAKIFYVLFEHKFVTILESFVFDI
jgi:hypothetical protein